MQVIIVKIGVSGLKKSIEIISIFDRYKWGHRGLVLDPLDINPHELLKKVSVW